MIKLKNAIVTEPRIRWLYYDCLGVIFRDFTGYSFSLLLKFNILVFILIHRSIFISNVNLRKRESNRKYRRAIKSLFKYRLVEYKDLFKPFPEFCLYNNLKLNPENIHYFDTRLFGDLRHDT